MNRVGWLATAVCIALTTAIAAQGAGQSGTGAAAARLAGRVVADDTPHTPIRGAIVTASGDTGRARSVVTDDMGTFDFANLPAGRYTLTASKSPFVPMSYGSKRADRPGTAISVESGQAIRELVIQLPRGAVITGTLRDQNGDTLPDISVVAIRMEQIDSQTAARALSYAGVTDDRGVFRIFGLPSGKYLVAGTLRVTGLGGDIAVPSTADVDRLFAELRRPATAPVGGAATSGSAASPAPALPAAGFAPTFYPGTVSAGDAEIVRLGSGEQRSTDFVIVPVRTGSVEGVIQMYDGSPVPPVIPNLGTIGPPLPLAFGMTPSLVARPGPDGRFKFNGVLPGKYTLDVSTQLGRAGSSAPAVAGMTELVFTGADVTGVTVTLRPGARFAGRIAFEGSTAPPADLTAIRISLTSQSMVSGAMFFNGTARPLGGSAPVKADGTFDVGPLLSAAYGVSAAGPGGWGLRSAMVNGREVLDGTFDVGFTDIAGAVLTLSDRHSELSGTLQTPANAAAADYFIVVFPSDSSMWRPGARRIRSTRPATDGHFTIRDLPAGDYLLATLTDVDPSDLGDPAFLAQLVPAAVKLSLADGETKTQNLRIAGR